MKELQEDLEFLSRIVFSKKNTPEHKLSIIRMIGAFQAKYLSKSSTLAITSLGASKALLEFVNKSL